VVKGDNPPLQEGQIHPVNGAFGSGVETIILSVVVVSILPYWNIPSWIPACGAIDLTHTRLIAWWILTKGLEPIATNVVQQSSQ